ncbi:MAG: hypothetical protein ABEJ85_00850 [Haloarculaceae archaeon]
MPEDEVTRQAVSDDECPEPPAPEGVETVEAYELDDGVVLYDAENPLAWVRTTRPVTLEEQA